MDRTNAEILLAEAYLMNQGEWIEHSKKVALLAEKIACRAGLDVDKAYIFGLLHDIGRRNGNMQARHAIEGYRFLTELGFEEGARICLTHTFQYKDVDAIYDDWDCTEEEKGFIAKYLEDITYNDYDKLIQLCDALSMTNGYCYAERKMASSVLKFGFKDTTTSKWKAILELKEHFDDKIGGNVYSLFDSETFAIPAVGAIIVKHIGDEEYILVQNRKKNNGDGCDGQLEIPAGKIRTYENIFEALRREVWEETGLRLTKIWGEEESTLLDVAGNETIALSPYCVTQNLSGAYSLILNTFLCEAEGELLERSDETENIRWMKREELKKIVMEKPESIFLMHVQALRKYLGDAK